MLHKNIYLAGTILGAFATMVTAAEHELGWTVLGAICVGCNWYNYLRASDEKEGE